MGRFRRAAGGVVVLVLVVIAVFAWRWWDERASFDSERWRVNGECRNHVRRPMVDDLQSHHVRPGMSCAAVLDLLGQPDYRASAGRLSYFTGPSLTDCFIFDVELRGGRVTGTSEWEN